MRHPVNHAQKCWAMYWMLLDYKLLESVKWPLSIQCLVGRNIYCTMYITSITSFHFLQGCGALWPPHHSAGPETRAPRRLHYTQQHRLLPERTEPQSDPGAGGQLPTKRQVHVRHHHQGKWDGGGVPWILNKVQNAFIFSMKFRNDGRKK